MIVVEGAQSDVFAAVTTGDQGQRFANQIEDVGSGSDEESVKSLERRVANRLSPTLVEGRTTSPAATPSALNQRMQPAAPSAPGPNLASQRMFRSGGLPCNAPTRRQFYLTGAGGQAAVGESYRRF